MLKEIKKLSEKLDFLSKDFNHLKSEELPNNFFEIKNEIQKIYDLLRNLKNEDGTNSNYNTEASNLELVNEFNDKLSNKVNCDDFDVLRNEIALLHERINALGKDKPSSMTDINRNNGGSLSTKDSNVLKDMVGKTNDLESLIRKLQKFVYVFYRNIQFKY